jgi:hypothetical protein
MELKAVVTCDDFVEEPDMRYVVALVCVCFFCPRGGPTLVIESNGLLVGLSVGDVFMADLGSWSFL